jgi:4-amino-4-deoxy-L-arabinose transferase-like glycosyltransferase
MADSRSGTIQPTSKLWLLAFPVLLFFLLGTGSLPLLDRDEPRFAEATREMLQSGDWIVPRLNGQDRFDKPPLIYWLQAAAFLAFGESEAAARLPAAACAAGTVLASAFWARRIAGERAGWYAGLILASAPLMQIHSRLSVADMPMVLFFVLTCRSGWECTTGSGSSSSRRLWHAAFPVFLAFGFLAKGPVAWLPGVIAVWQGRRLEPFRRFRWAWIVPLVLLLVGLWGIPALLRTQGRFLEVGIGKHVIGRSFTVMEGHGLGGFLGYLGAIPFHFLMLFPGLFPWSIPLARRLPLLRRWRNDGGDAAWLLGTSLLVLVVFSFVRTKLPHYTLPAYPLLAVWIATRLAADGAPMQGVVLKAGAQIAAITAIAFFGTPLLRERLPVRALVAEASPWIDPDSEVATVGFDEPSAVWYLRARTQGFVRHLEPDELDDFLAGKGPRLCLVAEGPKTGDILSRWPGLRRFEASGINIANGKPVRLRLLVREADSAGGAGNRILAVPEQTVRSSPP